MLCFTGANDDLAFAKATRLPDLLQSECSQLEEQKKKLRLDRAKRDKQFWHYYQVKQGFSNFFPGDPNFCMKFLRDPMQKNV